ncbi:MAG TPA: NAD(P)-dependent oxidoreductase [Solirubrobacteraceae bacterium]|jgi:nucleoside-diphosphate-sugar epimerase
MARVLITGGAGYVGGWLTDRAIEAGHEVRVYDLLLYEDRYLKEVPFFAGDVLDYDRLRPHLDWADACVYLAGLVGDPACALDPSLTNKINLDSVRWLCERFDGRIVFPSTCSVYGAEENELDEGSPTNPLSLYAQSKLDAEAIITERRPDSLILRLATLAGLGDTYSRIRLDLVVNLLVVRARLIGELEVFGGNQYRPLLHVRDVATAAVPHIDTDVSGIYNLGTENVTILELARRVVDRVGRAEIRVVDVPFQDTRNYRVSFRRAKESLGFAAQHSIDDAIDEIAELIDAGRVKDLSMAQFSNLEALRPYLRPEAIPFGREVRNAHMLARHASPAGAPVTA